MFWVALTGFPMSITHREVRRSTQTDVQHQVREFPFSVAGQDSMAHCAALVYDDVNLPLLKCIGIF